jgi:hypothetical protein
MLTAAILDSIGEDLSFWAYLIEFLPVGHNAFPFNFGIVPVGFMLLHQYLTSWKYYFIGLFLFAFVFAYIGEPFSEWIGVYQLYKWKFTYSFFYYLLNGFIIRIFIERVKKQIH